MWKKVGYVKGSKYRTMVMKSLNEGPKIPTEIADDIEIYRNHVSNTLNQLKDEELIECINPEMRKGRLYRLTDLGEEVVDKL